MTLNDNVETGPDVLYEVRNDGRKDLDSEIVERPITSDRVRYPIARLGSVWADLAELGPLPMGASCGLMLCVGATPTLPEFRVRVTCRAGEDTWTLSKFLEPRPSRGRATLRTARSAAVRPGP